MSDEAPNIVYGRLLESAHISGYGFERMTDELLWILQGDRWQKVGAGYTNINDFLRSIDLSAFNIADKKKLHQRIKELQPEASAPAIAAATGVHRATAARHVAPATKPASDQQERDDHVAPATSFDHSPKDVADLSRQRTARQAKDAERAAQVAANRDLVAGVLPIDEDNIHTLVIDPPWDWGDEGDVDQFGRATPTYATMTIDELTAFNIPGEDDAHLYLWITNRSLPKGFDLLDAWGFRYITCLTWVKPSYGMGNYFRGQTEQVLFGVRGSLPLLRKDVGTVFHAPRGDRHSAKPAEFYELVETCSPGPWGELFARGNDRPGWITWGEAS